MNWLTQPTSSLTWKRYVANQVLLKADWISTTLLGTVAPFCVPNSPNGWVTPTAGFSDKLQALVAAEANTRPTLPLACSASPLFCPCHGIKPGVCVCVLCTTHQIPWTFVSPSLPATFFPHRLSVPSRRRRTYQNKVGRGLGAGWRAFLTTITSIAVKFQMSPPLVSWLDGWLAKTASSSGVCRKDDENKRSW